MTENPPIPPIPCKSLTPELRTSLVERTNILLLRIVRANLNTQYASETPSLASFRDVISAHGIDTDTILVEDFRAYVPLSDYESYRPFVDKFNTHSCKETEVMNLFAPGLPNFLAISSGTSGKKPKIFPKYHFGPQAGTSSYAQGLAAVLYSYGYMEIKEVEREPNLIVKRIPVCPSSAGMVRELEGWAIDDDDKRMALILPGHVAPWAASMIKHHRSSLMIHALFSLACRDLDRIFATFLSVFFDLLRHVDDAWEMVVSSIRDGIVPPLEGVDEVLSHLQAHFHANPERAAELREIGPPLSCAGWAARVWPKLGMLAAICSGPFAMVLPKVKDIVGPTVAIRNHGIVTSEAFIAVPYADSLEFFVLRSDGLLEFLDVADQESHETLCQAWDLEVGRQYEVILTTSDGLWRYRLGDIITVVGFDIDDGSPIITHSGRRNMEIRLTPVLISDTQLVAAVMAVGSDVIRVHEFTTMVDHRQSPPTVGFFIEPSGELGPKSYLAAQCLFDGLVATNIQHQLVRKAGWTRLPTVRILKPGTFMEYRQWIGSNMNVGHGQTKVPIVMLNSTSQEWILQRVIQEL